MRRNCGFALGAFLSVVATAVMVAIAAAQSPSPNAPAAPAPPPPASRQTQPSKPAQQVGQSSKILQVKTRLVTVDVVALDSHGNAVRDLKSQDFEVSDGGRQQIDKFAFIDKSPNASAKPATAAQPRAKGFYTNQAAVSDLAMPPTVVLMDSLNTDIQDLVQTRRHMLDMLKTLPSNTPVAVFLLGQSLRVVQDFTSDPALLRAAVDKAMSPSSPQDPMPEDDPSSISLAMFDANGGQESDATEALEDFEQETYSNQMDIRVRTTLDALNAIAHYLSAYGGRKNLIWVSESFPLVLWPDPDFGTGSGAYQASERTYGGQLQDTANALTDAQVAVYPVDARGLQTMQVFSASQQTVLRPNSAARTLAAQLRRENNARALAQDTMDALAEESGGETCKNTNDLSGCVESALKDSSSYYELAYSPENVKWDGGFRKITLKTSRPGVKLTYRRGYFAEDTAVLAQKQPPEKRLQQTCQDFLPSTEIPIAAQSVAPQKPDDVAFTVTIAPSGLSFAPDGSHKLSAEMVTCVYSAKGSTFQSSTRDLSQAFSDAAYASLQADGLHGYMDVPRAGISRVRIGVLDLQTGETGALDIPIPQQQVAQQKIAQQQLAKSAATPASSAPESAANFSIGFSLPSGQSGTLDWNGDALVYKGGLTVAQTAPAFFGRFYAQDFHCEAGRLTTNDSNSSHTPTLQLVFSNPGGQTSIIDLKGDHPAYSGTLPVDPSAKPFFDHLWYLMHCVAAPQN